LKLKSWAQEKYWLLTMVASLVKWSVKDPKMVKLALKPGGIPDWGEPEVRTLFYCLGEGSNTHEAIIRTRLCRYKLHIANTEASDQDTGRSRASFSSDS
jgi:hypothetical protein